MIHEIRLQIPASEQVESIDSMTSWPVETIDCANLRINELEIRKVDLGVLRQLSLTDLNSFLRTKFKTIFCCC